MASRWTMVLLVEVLQDRRTYRAESA